MKILFIAPRFDGGIGGHAKRVAEKLIEYGYEIKLMKTTHIPIKKLKNPSFAVLSSLRTIIKNEEFDIVHAFNVPSAFAMKYAKAKKKVLSIHGLYSEQVESLHSDITAKMIKTNELKVLNWADKVTTDSKAVRDAYKRKLGIDLKFLYAPLDVTKFEKVKEIPKKENQIIYIGRDSYEKGIDILKKIESKLNGNVIYCTNIEWEEAMSILKSSSILVIPSRMESIPQVIKEAFYLKIPVIATNVGGISELITNEENGVLVESENAHQLVHAINDLLGDKEKARKIGMAGHNFVIKNLTWEVLLPKYIKFYEDLLEQ